MALVLKLSVLEKTHIWKPFNVLMPLNDAFLFQNKENKILFGPPPQKKRRRDMNGRDMAPITCVCLYQQPVTWSFTGSRLSDSAQSNPCIKNYYLIIFTLSGPHFSIYNIFHTKGSTLNFNERATHFKGNREECC